MSVFPQPADTNLGSRLQKFLAFWPTITNNPLILGFIMGVKVEFHELRDTLDTPPNGHSWNPANVTECHLLMSKLLDLGVIVQVPKAEAKVVSPIFLTTNKDGSKYLILDTSQFNRTKIVR